MKKNNFSIFNSLIKISITAFCCLFIMINIINIVSAAGIADAFKVRDGSDKDVLDMTAKEAGYSTKADGIDTPFGFINPIFSKIIQTGLGFLGVIFVFLMIYGGFLWMSDQGNEDQVKKAKDLISAAIIGLIIVASCVLRLSFSDENSEMSIS